MEKYKLLVLADQMAARVLSQVGIEYEIFSGSRPLEINSEKEILELGNQLLKSQDNDTIVLAVYTELILEDKKLGIPRDEEEAYSMLEQLSGKDYSYVTRLCMGGSGSPVDVMTIETRVTFKELSEWEIKGFLKLADYSHPGAHLPYGKGAFFVRKISGDFNNIKGMPLAAVGELLEKKYGINPIDGKNIWMKGSTEND